jgi:ABC-type thiamine transport system substrate-binding protein
VDAANQFIEYLLSPEINTLMPEANLMYSVLDNTGLPETSGYQYHSDIPTQPSSISSERISQEMESWLSQWIVEVEF